MSPVLRPLAALVVASLALWFAPTALAASADRGLVGSGATCSRVHGRRHAQARPKPRTRPLPGTRVAVQPIEGDAGPSVRAQLVRLLAARGFRVVQSIPAVSGTAQYPGLAQERRIASFLVTSLEERAHSLTATFLVWRGIEGDVADRWSVSAPLKRFPRAVAKGFWQHLGPALCAAMTPPSGKLPPAPPMRIDAGSNLDEPIVSDVEPIAGRRAVR